MPQLSDTMNSGKILSWKKKEGETLARGDILAEVETDKANLEIECFEAGSLLKILTPVGASANVGDVIAVVGKPGEEVKALGAKNYVSTPPPAQPILLKSAAEPEPALEESPGARTKVSPLARRLAVESRIDFSSLRGSGPGGRVVKKDIEQALAQSCTTPKAAREAHSEPKTISAGVMEAAGITAAAQETPEAPTNIPGKLQALSKMRETIARRMQESARTVPHFYMSASIDMEQALRLKEILKEKPEYQGLTINHLVLKAAAYAISREPRVNQTIREEQVFEPAEINLGIITGLPEGLMIPVVRRADKLPLKELVSAAKGLVERVRAGRPTSADLSGGTFSISNMGMFDVEDFTAIINPGQGAVLAVGAIRKEPAVKQGQIVISQLMKVTVSLDHRVNDALIGANFLKYLKEGLENPALLLV